MKCVKCNGKGKRDNPKYYRYGCAVAYERGIQPMVNCKSCNGSGYIIGNIKDVINFLEHLKVKFELEKNKEYLREVEQCLKIMKE